MSRFRLAFALCLILAAPSMAAKAETVRFNVQCWAEGNTMRVYGDDRSDYLASTRLFLHLVGTEDGKKILRSVFGHVSAQKFVDGAESIKEVDFYSHLNANDVLSSESTRARVYPDSDYWRFNGIQDAVSTFQDGGGLWGTLVVSKDVDSSASRSGERFAAHLIFQHGDHTGGTMDLTCSRY